MKSSGERPDGCFLDTRNLVDDATAKTFIQRYQSVALLLYWTSLASNLRPDSSFATFRMSLVFAKSRVGTICISA